MSALWGGVEIGRISLRVLFTYNILCNGGFDCLSTIYIKYSAASKYLLWMKQYPRRDHWTRDQIVEKIAAEYESGLGLPTKEQH